MAVSREGGALPYARGLDGLRGLAVVAVLAFHLEASWARGGFLGVSLFFTLSGYLITQLLVAEHDRTGEVALGRFWARRLRRLAPASLVCLAVVAIGSATGVFAGPAVPGDVAAALAEAANWRLAAAGSSYADLFTAGPSPVLHFWSLAIEEQFYLLFPLLVAAVLVRRGRRLLAAVLAVGFVGGTAVAIASSADLAYYGTPARLPELLAGALLGLALPLDRHRPATADRRLAAAGAVGASGLLLLVVTASTTSWWVEGGGLPAVSLLSAAVVAACTGTGPIGRIAGWAPLVAIGRRSYGIYVYHWPLFLLLDADRLGIDGWPLALVRLGATASAAWLSFSLLEQPIRHGARLTGPVLPRRALAGGAVVVLVAAALAPGEADQPAGLSAPVGVVSFDGGPGGGGGVRHLVVTVLGSEPAVADWLQQAAPAGLELEVHDGLRPGCPLLLPDQDAPGCPSYAATAAASIAATTPDLVVVGIGAGERAPLADLERQLADAPPATRFDVASDALTVAGNVGAALLDPLPTGPVLVVDTRAGSEPDVLAGVLPYAVVQRPDTELRTLASPDGVAQAVAEVMDHVGRARQRLLVVGDSTSYEVAGALGQVASDRFEVLWAGGHNCPIVPVRTVRWWDGAEWSRTECPSTASTWPDVIARFRPDIVLVMCSLAELAEQGYDTESGWFAPGDAEWIAVHEGAMADLQALLAGSGAVTIVATTPPIAAGTGFAESPMAQPDRMAAWSAQQQRWDDEWSSVAEVDWAAMVAAADAAAGHNLRPDGVHFADGVLAPLVETQLVPALDGTAAALRSGGQVQG